MYALAITGESGTQRVAETLADHLTARGSVGTITRESRERTDGGAEPGVHRSYRLSETGDWAATGGSLSLDDALDELAKTCEYAVVEGYADVDLPTVVVGDEQVDRGDVLVRLSAPEELDVELVVEKLEDTDPYETLESLVTRIKQSADEEFSGAIATFTGRVRAKEHADDDPTEYLEFERYDAVAEQRMAQIKAELEAREQVYEVLLHHKTGVVEAGEDIVFVVVLAGHREQAFRTVEDGINRLKEEVPLFKKEVTVDDEFWAHTGRPE